uniref:4-alpha-methylsterol monooxygenase n=1 Tax=Opuntia streptacantha TaxID=393608 RepID=A0A7C8Z9H3_OPUST
MLPYTTVEEAEAALNRTLTVAETLWLKYSANKSDYLLYCHNLPFFFLSFSLVPLPLIAVELIPYFRRYKTQPHVKTPLPQMMACYMNVIKTYILYVGPFQLLSYPAVKV